MTVAEHLITHERSVRMRIELDGAAYATVFLDGEANMPCFCGQLHRMEFEAQLGCGSDLDPVNLNDLEGAIRGNDDAAQRLGWRLLVMLFNRGVPPCQKNHVGHPQ